MRLSVFSRLLAGASMAMMIAGPGTAETLQDALVKAYKTNPTLTGARANQQAIDENVPQARANGLPSVTLQSAYAENVLIASNGYVSPARQLTAQSNVSMPVYSGGAVHNAVKAAETRVDAGRASLRGTEADLFTAVVGAYMDVIRDEAIVSLNQQNVKVLEVNLQASRDRFQVGDLTRTDVAQSEARLALARGQLQSAEARLISSRESYVQLVGSPPGQLEIPPDLPKLPADPDAAVEVALQDNPSLLAAKKSTEATVYDIRVARASRLPKISLVASGSYYDYLNSLDYVPGIQQSGTSAQAGVQLSLPLYQGGKPAAQIRQAQDRRAQTIEAQTAAERSIIAQTRSAYAVWRSSLDVIQSSIVAVNANKLSLEGVRAENSVGNRTILEILNAEQELLNSQVTLVTARRDAYVAGFALLAAMGHAEAKDLGLDGGALYDPVANYKRVRGGLNDWAGAPDPQPVATSTAQTKAQNAAVNAALEPQLDAPVDTSAPNPANVSPRKE
jgi:outer membrane protein